MINLLCRFRIRELLRAVRYLTKIMQKALHSFYLPFRLNLAFTGLAKIGSFLTLDFLMMKLRSSFARSKITRAGVATLRSRAMSAATRRPSKHGRSDIISGSGGGVTRSSSRASGSAATHVMRDAVLRTAGSSLRREIARRPARAVSTPNASRYSALPRWHQQGYLGEGIRE
jgi:hypothetical protein